jgi:hypothetical protein
VCSEQSACGGTGGVNPPIADEFWQKEAFLILGNWRY